jgi:hypothetical protein
MQLVQPVVGSRAPQLSITSASPRTSTITWQSFVGHPVVLAFVDEWSPETAGSEAIHALRRELTGLGAALLIISDEHAWCFRPDDDIERYSPLPARNTGELFQSYGVDERCLSAGDVALFVIDGAHVVRFARMAPSREHATDTLVYALTMAGCKLIAGRSRGIALPRRELVILSLVNAFSLILPDGWLPDGLSSFGL